MLIKAHWLFLDNLDLGKFDRIITKTVSHTLKMSKEWQKPLIIQALQNAFCRCHVIC